MTSLKIFEKTKAQTKITCLNCTNLQTVFSLQRRFHFQSKDLHFIIFVVLTVEFLKKKLNETVVTSRVSKIVLHFFIFVILSVEK